MPTVWRIGCLSAVAKDSRPHACRLTLVVLSAVVSANLRTEF